MIFHNSDGKSWALKLPVPAGVSNATAPPPRLALGCIPSPAALSAAVAAAAAAALLAFAAFTAFTTAWNPLASNLESNALDSNGLRGSRGARGRGEGSAKLVCSCRSLNAISGVDMDRPKGWFRGEGGAKAVAPGRREGEPRRGWLPLAADNAAGEAAGA